MATRVEIPVLSGNVATTEGGSQYLVHAATGAVYFIGVESANDVVYRKSTDNGLTWGPVVSVFTGSTTQLSVWYDEWSGVSGGKIRMAYTESAGADTLYRDLDVDTDTLGTQTTIFAGASTQLTLGALSICTARSGYVYCLVCIDRGAESEFVLSTDGGATWDATRASAGSFESANLDEWILCPSWSADTNDIMCVFWDASADEVSRKVYDHSGDAWAESSFSTGMVDDASSAFPSFAVAVDTTNSRNVLIAWNGVDTANQDLKCWYFTDSAITACTDVVTNATDDCGLAALAVDAYSGAWYAFWCGKTDGSETWNTSVNVYYARSADSGSTWSSPAQLSATALQTPALFAAPRAYGFPFVKRQVVIGVSGGQVQSIFAPLRGPTITAQVFGG